MCYTLTPSLEDPLLSLIRLSGDISQKEPGYAFLRPTVSLLLTRDTYTVMKRGTYCIFLSFSIGVVPGRPSQPHNKDERRLSFMVGFWKSISAKSRGKDKAGPGQTFPSYDDSRYTWHLEMRDLHLSSSSLIEPKHMMSAPLYEISSVWCPIGDSYPQDGESIKNPSYLSCFQGF